MATPSSNASQASKSRGHSLFDRQAQRHGGDLNKEANATIVDGSPPTAPLRPSHSVSPPSISSVSQSHRKIPLTVIDSCPQLNDTNVRLISVNPRPEPAYIKEISSFTQSPPPPPPPPPPPLEPASTHLQETEFPLYDNCPTDEPEDVLPTNTTCAAIVQQAFDYLPSHDDDDDVIHEAHHDEQDDYSQSFDGDDNDDHSSSTNELDGTTTIIIHQQADSEVSPLATTEMNGIPTSEDKFDDQQIPTVSSSRSGMSNEDYDSDFDDSSPEDDEQVITKDTSHDDEEEQQNQILIRQQQILWGIVQEWSRKEESYCEQLQRMVEQFSFLSNANEAQKSIQTLIDKHKQIYREIEDLYDRDQKLDNLIKRLTKTVDTLMDTLPVYIDYFKINLAPIKKSLDKRVIPNGFTSEDLLSVPPKQFLQILSQVQDLYQTSQSFECDDKECLNILYHHASRCRVFGNKQDENINKVILKNEEVIVKSSRDHRERYRLVLYPDAIVCCNLKSKLLASPKYVVVWFIPMVDLQWAVPEKSADENADAGDELKTSLKSVYKELERAPKTNTTRLSKNIRKQENEFQLAQSKLQLLLWNTLRSSATPPHVILFSSAYQLQDWVDFIDKTKQDLVQRNSAVMETGNHATTRLTDSIIQKRLDLIKPNVHETNPNDSSSTIQTLMPSKTYSGTLYITIHSILGSALYNPGRQCQTLPLASSAQQKMQKNYQFYVAVEIDSYNTFYPHAQTSRQTMQQKESVEFKGEVFHVELEYSLAFRLLIYRIDTDTRSNDHSLQRPLCIGKFHHDIETALRDCQRSTSGTIFLESQSGDLKLKISLQYSKREGTFKRQTSKRSLAVFGKSIDKLMSTPSGLIDDIPRIVVKCIEIVERDGLTETGIYRVCCVASDLQKLRHEFDRNSNRAEEMLAQKNVHVAANLLKLFFRELPDPLFCSILYKQFLHAVQLTDIDNQRVTLLNTIDSLPAANRKILFYLFDHLIRISQYSNQNMMHLENLAVVFGPTLMRPSKLILATIYADNSNQRLNTVGNGQGTSTDLDQMSSELQGSMYQCQVVLACLKLRRDQILK
ncbi:unnamed protein product [Adineta ricciae]|uniref:Rho-GAP domain-containing protein n=1 Tax=Adineta ricciae TaxID=249248 RepID=A0A814AQ06_ADIRI|nr:unnamed protein product [Adineta ricciae]CAF1005669.1 unnamed protein product [Adineta ricciae]